METIWDLTPHYYMGGRRVSLGNSFRCGREDLQPHARLVMGEDEEKPAFWQFCGVGTVYTTDLAPNGVPASRSGATQQRQWTYLQHRSRSAPSLPAG